MLLQLAPLLPRSAEVDAFGFPADELVAVAVVAVVDDDDVAVVRLFAWFVGVDEEGGCEEERLRRSG